MHGSGVGVRLNLMGKALPDFRDSGWRDFFGHLPELGWHVELHRHVEDLPQLIRQLTPFGITLVIDHFGRLDARSSATSQDLSRCWSWG